VRKLATAAAVSLVLASGGVRALGLGDIEMRSALNQPMNAEIRLTSVQPGEANGMIVKLASPEAFARAGIDRTSALTDLRFSVNTSSGSPVIQISSNKPVVEPFLNFLLEVEWQTGKMVREYTVLLDPPVFMTPTATQSSSAAAPETQLRSGELNAPAPIERTDDFAVELAGSGNEIANDVQGGDVVDLDGLGGGEAVSLDGLGELDVVATSPDIAGDTGDVVVLSDLEVANTDAAADFNFEVEVVGDAQEVSNSFVDDGFADNNIAVEEIGDSEIVSLDLLDTDAQGSSASVGGAVTVAQGDTLYEIATRNAVAGVSVQQMMIALLNANKSSFIQDNINLVKAGAILRIPDAAELGNLSQAQAVAAVSEQEQLWREYRDSVRSTSGTRVAANDTAPADTDAAQSEETQAESAESEAPSTSSVAANDTDAAGSTAASAGEAAGEEKPELSDAAKRILEEAKQEALQSGELKIVAEGDSTSTTASATADNSETSKDAQIGALDKQLQLAREELAATQREATDLSEQSLELKSTTENQESLLSIRQREVARLQELLQQASEDADAAGVIDNAQEATTDAATDAVTAVSEGAENAVEGAADAVADAGDAAADMVGQGADAATNAITQAGEKLPEVDLVPEPTVDTTATDATAASTTTAAPEAQPWYASLLQKYGKWLVIGIGALSALFAGLLLFGKRKRNDDEILDFDEEEFANLDDVDVTTEGSADISDDAGLGGQAAAAATAAAAAGGAAAHAFGGDDEAEAEAEAEAITANDATAASDELLDADDTISEAEVYLAYGLHGQAEELLTKAIEKNPNNAEYQQKLLQTHHAQGNADAFVASATQYHEKFGGDASPEWASISGMGQELQPNNMLFANSGNVVESVGKGDYTAEKLDDNDFMANDATEAVDSVIAGSDTTSETNLMDQSLDPAFAFDETDLEATGDFTQITEELVGEGDGTIDFPGFDAVESAGDAVKDKMGAVAGAGAAAVGGIGAAASDSLDDALNFDDLSVGNDAANDGLQAAEASIAEDLTLDLDEISGDLDLGEDATEALEIPDLTSDNELLSGEIGSLDSSDEMDTMMDLAKAYIDMGDKDSASSALGEIVKSGTPSQVSEAETLLRKIS